MKRERVEKAIHEHGVEKIIKIAYDEWNSGGWNGICLLNPEGGLEGYSISSGSMFSEKMYEYIELYRLEANWVANNCWDDHNMIVDDDEWEELQDRFGDEADFTDQDQLQKIGVDWNKRAVEYLVCDVLENLDEYVSGI